MFKRTVIFSILTFFIAGTPAFAKKKSILPSEQSVYHNNQGITVLSQGNLEKAAFEFQTAIELAPQFAEPYNNLGLIYKIKGENDKAIEYFQKAIGINGNYASPHSHLAAVYLAQGRLQDALKEAQRAVKIDPLMADPHYNLGLVWLEMYNKEKRQKHWSNAESEFKKATIFNPNLELVHLRLAEMYHQQGKNDLAVIRYRLALNANNNPETWRTLGNLYMEMGDPFKAQNCFQKAIELNPKIEDAQLQLGLFYLQQKKTDEAKAAFEKVVEQNPKNEKAFFNLGVLKMDAGLFQEAIDYFKKAKEVNPGYADATYNLGVCYLKVGKTDQAKEAWEYTLTVQPNYARASYNLGLLAAKSGRMDEAGQQYCCFLQASQGKFPTEELLAKQFIEENKIKCPN